jgi:hypothetical protein
MKQELKVVARNALLPSRLLACLDCLTLTFRRYVDTAEPTHTMHLKQMPGMDDFLSFRASRAMPRLGPQVHNRLVSLALPS